MICRMRHRFQSSVTTRLAMQFQLRNIVVPLLEGRRRLFLQGTTTEHKTCFVEVNDFKVSILLRPNELCRTPEDVDSILSDSGLSGAVDIHYTPRVPFIGFTNKTPVKLIQLNIKLAKFYTVRRLLQENGLQLYHDDISLVNQCLIRLGVSFGDWISVTGAILRKQFTVRGVEFAADCKHLGKVDTALQVMSPTTLFLRLRCVSQHSVADGSYTYQADARRKYDRIVAIYLAFGAESYTLALSPGVEGCEWFGTERALLKRCVQLVRDLDPDVLVTYNDYLNTLSCLAYRCLAASVPFEIERLSGLNVYVPRDRPFAFPVKLKTRGVVDIMTFLKKKVFVSTETYDLFTVSSNPSFRQAPTPVSALGLDSYFRRHNQLFLTAPAEMCRNLRDEVELVRALEADMRIVLEILNLSKVSDTTFSDVVFRGEQIRVFNTLCRYIEKRQFFINRDALDQPPLRFSTKERPPTLDESTLKCLRIPAASMKPARKRQRSVFGGVASSVKTEKILEGGSVLKPTPGFHRDYLGIFDFKSLYPSIMIGYNISYENLVNDPAYLDVDGVEYMNVKINESESIVIAQQPGLFGEILTHLLSERVKVKRQMKSTDDPFLKAVLDKTQLSLKVLCNSTYGFCGAPPKIAVLAIREVMYTVTSIGRYLQRRCCDFFARKYEMATLYGDTDSVFMRLAVPPFSNFDDARVYLEQKYDIKFSARHILAADQYTLNERVRHLLFPVSDKLCEEASALFAESIVLENENLAFNFFTSSNKKCYFYRKYEPYKPQKHKLKITGMPALRRENSAWARRILYRTTQLLSEGRSHEVLPFLKTELGKLKSFDIDVNEFRLSKLFKSWQDYKTTTGIHIAIVQNWCKHHKALMQENTRITYFVVSQPGVKLYRRGRSVINSVHDLDRGFYCRQLKKPLLFLLQFMPTAQMNAAKLFNSHLSFYTTKSKSVFN